MIQENSVALVRYTTDRDPYTGALAQSLDGFTRYRVLPKGALTRKEHEWTTDIRHQIDHQGLKDMKDGVDVQRQLFVVQFTGNRHQFILLVYVQFTICVKYVQIITVIYLYVLDRFKVLLTVQNLV